MQIQKIKYTNSCFTTNKIVEENNYAFVYLVLCYYYLIKELSDIIIEINTYTFQYDVNGNITSDDGGSSRFHEYDYADRLRCFHIQAGTSEPTIYTQYLYDAGGNRIKKYTRNSGGGITSTVYIDGVFEYTTDGTDQQNTIHIMDDRTRIATIRMGDAMGDTTPAIKYNLDDHLGSSNILVDSNGTLVSTEEYYPFGETAFGSYALKRYRFCGKEKDEESGLYYYGMRYYSPWTCRFITVDPLAAKYAHLTPYAYADNKPINFTDIDGAETGSTNESPGGGRNASNSAGKGGGGGTDKADNMNCNQKSTTQSSTTTENGVTTYKSETKSMTQDGDNIQMHASKVEMKYNSGTGELISFSRNEVSTNIKEEEKREMNIVEGAYFGIKDAVYSRIDWMQRFKTSEGRSQNWSSFKSSLYSAYESFTYSGFQKNIGVKLINYFSSLPEKSGGELAYDITSFSYNAINSTSDATIATAGIGFVPAYLRGTFTTEEGFAFGSINLNKGLPFNLSVRRFGSPTGGHSTIAPKLFGSEGFGRTFLAIKHTWTPGKLGSFKPYILPKGTPLKIGIVGPQGVKYPGGYLQIKSELGTLQSR